MPEDAPPRKGAPVDGGWQTYECVSGDYADDAVGIVALFQRADQIDLRPAGGLFHVGRVNPLFLQASVEPRDEQHISQPRLDVRRARKKRVRHRVTQTPEPHLVERAPLVEQIQHSPHLVAVARRQVYPGQRRLHFAIAIPARTPSCASRAALHTGCEIRVSRFDSRPRAGESNEQRPRRGDADW